MIATLRGVVTEKFAGSLVIEASGVGYELFVTTADWGSAQVGNVGTYYVFEQIREDSYNLYGFITREAQQLFMQLIAVNGVGPKIALQILSSAGEARLRQAITAGDPELFKGVSGVGPKTAQRIVVELRGQVAEDRVGLAPLADPTYQALISLGYTPPQATAALAKIPPDITGDEARLKAALQGIGQ